uniref:Uncharacterized protein n=1 Tax=Arundo donax TaxID=35708 RepID=A0A0A9HUR2_ARUDO
MITSRTPGFNKWHIVLHNNFYVCSPSLHRMETVSYSESY